MSAPIDSEAAFVAFMRDIEDYDSAEPPLNEAYAKAFARFQGPLHTEEFKKAEAMLAAAHQVAELPAEDRKRLVKIQGIVDDLKRFLSAIPFWYYKQVARIYAEIEPEITADTLANVQQLLETQSLSDQAETEHFNAMLGEDEPLAILLRGHVLIENALDLVISRFLARPMNLHKELDIYFSGKVKLAYAFGILSDPERQMLTLLNRKRNSLVHQEHPELRNVPRYRFTVDEERELWTRFRETIGTIGPWPAYNGSKFPMFLKLALVTTLFRLTGRSNAIGPYKLREMDEQFREHTLTSHMGAGIAVFIVKVVPKLVRALRGNESREGARAVEADSS